MLAHAGAADEGVAIAMLIGAGWIGWIGWTRPAGSAASPPPRAGGGRAPRTGRRRGGRLGGRAAGGLRANAHADADLRAADRVHGVAGLPSTHRGRARHRRRAPGRPRPARRRGPSGGDGPRHPGHGAPAPERRRVVGVDDLRRGPGHRPATTASSSRSPSSTCAGRAVEHPAVAVGARAVTVSAASAAAPGAAGARRRRAARPRAVAVGALAHQRHVLAGRGQERRGVGRPARAPRARSTSSTAVSPAAAVARRAR